MLNVGFKRVYFSVMKDDSPQDHCMIPTKNEDENRMFCMIQEKHFVTHALTFDQSTTFCGN